ncbi:MAG: DUF4136 domain-containing protein [Gemmatimonadales bacterium]
MRAPMMGTVAVMALVFAGCAPATEVHTVAAPEPELSSLRTFRLEPARPDNSPATHALGHDIAADLTEHGYSQSDNQSDVIVEYGTAAPEDLDPTDWAYDFVWRPKGWRNWASGAEDASAAEYENGALVIDVIDARTRQLLWRGHAEADTSGDERSYEKNLGRAVTAILGRLPEARLATRG